jgi:ankyrin repeat protein
MSNDDDDDDDDDEDADHRRHLTGQRRKADAISRLAATISSESSSKRQSSGRGSTTGWVACPLCSKSRRQRQKQRPKVFALGRGIAAHLQAVHTPWKQPPQSRKQHTMNRRERKKQRSEQKIPNAVPEPTQGHDEMEAASSESASASTTTTERTVSTTTTLSSSCWKPTQEEIDAWDAKVLQIVQELDAMAAAAALGSHDESVAPTSASVSLDGDAARTDSSSLPSDDHAQEVANRITLIGPGVDRTGTQRATAYRTSLPLFLQHAADGNLPMLQQMVEQQASHELASLLATKDRHGSVAEHWAAGGGHLECLDYLVQQQQCLAATDDDGEDAAAAPAPALARTMRRRDGKTSLHYAARYGHVPCINYLLSLQPTNQPIIHDTLSSLSIPYHVVDEPSGDGTTPFHLACLGGHLPAAQCLLEQHGANPLAANDWGCTAAHWLAMTDSQDVEMARAFARMLLRHKVSFVKPQKQGHTALHKAAQRRNQWMIEWMGQTTEEGGAGLVNQDKLAAGAPDDGGHRPSDIWLSVGGDASFSEWMSAEMNW